MKNYLLLNPFRRNITLTLAWLSCIGVYAQPYQSGSYRSSNSEVITQLSESTVTYTIATVNVEKSKLLVENFTQQRKYDITKLNSTPQVITVLFWMPVKGVNALDSLLTQTGVVSYKNISIVYDPKVSAELKLDLEFQKKWLADLELQSNFWRKDTSKVGMEKYNMVMSQQRNKEIEINQLIKRINNYESNKDLCLVSIYFKNEDHSNDSKLSNVRMPGIEYSYMLLNQPKEGITSSAYSGLSVRYIFTKGKDYINFSAYQSNKKVTDSTTFNQLFNLMIAQDFYSRKYGQGKYRFFNPYIGYQAGASLASNQLGIEVIPCIAPTFGLELYKGKSFLIDVHTHYNLPVSSKFNQLRGWVFNGGLNFVF